MSNRGRARGTTALAIQQSAALFPGWSTEQVDLVSRTIAPDLNTDELALYISVADRAGLDVFTRQVYAFKNSQGRVCIGIGIDGLRAKADETGAYAPGPKPVYETSKDGKCVSCTASVLKHVAGIWVTVEATAYFKECYQAKSPNWENRPLHMIAKCAEALALRKAFPRQIGQLGSEREVLAMAAEHPSDAAATVIDVEATVVEPGAPAPHLPPQQPSEADGFQIGGKPLDLQRASAKAWITEAYKEAGLEVLQAKAVIDQAVAAFIVPDSPDQYEARHVKLLVEMFERAAAAGIQPAEPPPAEPPPAESEPAPEPEPEANPPTEARQPDGSGSVAYRSAMIEASNAGATPDQIKAAQDAAGLLSQPPEKWGDADQDCFLGELVTLMQATGGAQGA